MSTVDVAGERAGAKYERRKEMILQAAVAVMAQKGVKGMTLAEVAAKLDLVPTAVSYYFRRKEDLAAACFLRAIDRYQRFISGAEAAGENPRERVRAFVRLFFEDLAVRRVGGAEAIVPFSDVRAVGDPAVNAAYVGMFRRLRGAVFPREEGPALTRVERNARTHLLFSQMFWAPVWAADYDDADLPRAAARMADILLDGFAAPGSALEEPPARVLDEPEAGGVGAFLRAATRLINEEGYRGASVSKISSRLNVTKGSFYHHNAAKDDLVAACFERTLAIMTATQHAAEQAPRGLDRVVASVAALVRAEVSGETPLLRTSALSSAPQTIRPELIRRFARVALRFASQLSDGVADGSARPVDTHIAAHMIAGAVNAASELRHWATEADADAAYALYVRPVVLGLSAPPI